MSEMAGYPTQDAPLGVKFDFNLGCRIQLPAYAGDSTRKLRLYEDDSHYYEVEFNSSETISIDSKKCHFQNFRIELYEDKVMIFNHDFVLRNKNVLILTIAGLGDILAWMQHIERFRETHGCNLYVAITAEHFELFDEAYPHIHFMNKNMMGDKLETVISDLNIYATYILAYNLQDEENRIWQPIDRRQRNIAQIASDILGLDPNTNLRPCIRVAPERPIKEKYVCIGVQAGSDCKLWQNPYGWLDIVKYLTNHNYRVICIDRERNESTPQDCEDETGNRPLSERARWLAHADLFIGLGSGLSWLAWSVHCPVVLISGFSHPLTEFQTPYRVINWGVCNSCWNDPAYVFDTKNRSWCPRHKGTPRMFECSKKITSEMVIAMIDKALE